MFANPENKMSKNEWPHTNLGLSIEGPMQDPFLQHNLLNIHTLSLFTIFYLTF